MPRRYHSLHLSRAVANYSAYGFLKGPLVDINTYYKTNSLGYRGNEFKNNQDIVALGCSFTFGMGVPEEAIWSSFVSNELNLGCDNLGLSGGSIFDTLTIFFAYCREYGNPKTVLALFPDISRVIFNDDKGQVRSSFFLPKTSKKPHELTNIISTEYGNWQAAYSIYILESYCIANNINLIYSTWHYDQTDWLIKNLTEFSDLKNVNFIDISDCFFSEVTKCNVHEDLKIKYGDYCFAEGGDIEEGRPHWGTHVHKHIAEKFLTEIKLRGLV